MGTHSTRRVADRRPGRPGLALIEPLPDDGAAAWFDAAFYLDTYPDVAGFPGEPRDHYLRHGRAELRYPNQAALDADIALVRASGQFDADTFLALYGPHEDPIRRFLVDYRFGPLRPNGAFDGAFVQAYYGRTLRAGENPFLFYCRHRCRPWCYASMEEGREAAEVIARSPLFDAGFVRASHLAGREGLSPEVYYLTEGFRLLHDPSERFSTAAYLYDNPDLVLAQMNPLLHYEMNGRAEQRPMASPAEVRVMAGGVKADPRRRTLLLVTHQASRTGAPILALNLLRRLSGRFNIVTLMMEGGPLLEDFRRMSCAAVVSGMRPGQIEAAVQALTRDRALDCALLNTVVAAYALDPLVRRGVPILTLIHDFAQYTRPLGLHARTVALSDRVIYPAALVRDAALAEIEALMGQPASPANIEVRSQGRCLVPSAAPAAVDPAAIARAFGRDRPGRRPLTVIGAGHIEPRKGVDLFIETARAVRQDLEVDCRFVWIGGGYDPDLDAHVSVYLQDQVRKSGLEDVVVFVEAQDALEPWMTEADAFFMSSRLDPFPNVVLDALALGLPVVCFEGATGAAELAADFPDQIRAAPYLRTREAAEALVELGRGRRRAGGRKLQRRLDFDPYADHVASALEAVAAEAGAERARAGSSGAAPRVDPGALAASLPAWLASPLARSGPTRARLAQLAARLEAGALPLGVREPGVLAGGGARYRSISLEAAAAGAPDVVAVWADCPAQIRRLAEQLFRTAARPKVLAAGRDLRHADLAPLTAILPRGAVRLLASSGGRAELRRNLAEAIPRGAIVHLLRLAAPGEEPLDPNYCRAACAALAADPDLRLVLARAVQTGPAVRLGGSGLGLPAHLVDQRQCWVRAADAGVIAAAVDELLACPRDGAWPAWGGSATLARADWAMVEPAGDGGPAFDLTWGREELDVRW